MAKGLNKHSEDIFVASGRLRNIIESHGWTLYEIVDDPEKNELLDLQGRGPFQGAYEFGTDYIFMPILGEDETLIDTRQRIMIQQRSGPALDIMGEVVPFTRIEFGYDSATVMSPPPLHPGASIPYDNNNLIKTFEDCFFIQTPLRRKKFNPDLN